MKTINIITVAFGVFIQIIAEAMSVKIIVSISLAFAGGFFAYMGKELAAKLVKRWFNKSEQNNAADQKH
jgi:hypothetical protein